MLLGEVEETHTEREVDEETNEEHIVVRALRPGCSVARTCGCAACARPDAWYAQTKKRKMPMLFVRGDVVILVAPPVRTS
jgi:hypothetical protein